MSDAEEKKKKKKDKKKKHKKHKKQKKHKKHRHEVRKEEPSTLHSLFLYCNQLMLLSHVYFIACLPSTIP